MIKKIAKVAGLAIAVGSMNLAVIAPAQAQADGFTCGFVSITDPTGEGDVQTGEVDGGPVVAGDVVNQSVDPTASITIKCTIQVGPTGQTHAGPDAAAASANGTGVAVLPPTAISYVAPEGADVWLCTEVTVNGTTYYFDDTNATFSTSSSVDCGLAISQEVDPGPTDPVFDALNANVCPFLLAIDARAGTDLAGTWQDCEPYSPII